MSKLFYICSKVTVIDLFIISYMVLTVGFHQWFFFFKKNILSFLIVLFDV